MLNRTVAPPFKRSNSLTLINPEETILGNGLRIIYVNGGEQEVIKIEFIFKAGKWYEPKAGVSYFTSHLLQKGTISKNSNRISSTFDHQGIHIEINSGYDYSSISLYGLSKNIDRVLTLTNEILTQPSFPESELAQAKDIYIQGLRINLEKTNYLAALQFRKNLFSDNHPYGKDATVDEIKLLERDDLISFHKQAFINMDVICSGKISPSIRRSIEKSFENFSIDRVSEPSVTRKEIAPFKMKIDKEGAVQSSIRLGKMIVGRTHQDYPALLLLNHIFGGYFGSRLMKNIREEKGLTYGIYSSIAALKHNTYISIGADVNNENSELTIAEIKKEIQSLRSVPIDSDELETARNHFIGSFQSEISTPFAHADKIKNQNLYGLPKDYYQSLLINIEKVSISTLLEIAQKYFEESSFFEVIAG